MKQAKFALTAVAILAVIGGALAFKANRTAKVQFYSFGTTNGQTGCVLTTTLSYIPDASGATTIALSSAPKVTLVNDCKATVRFEQ